MRTLAMLEGENKFCATFTMLDGCANSFRHSSQIGCWMGQQPSARHRWQSRSRSRSARSSTRLQLKANLGAEHGL
jgi:hypothetical protein